MIVPPKNLFCALAIVTISSAFTSPVFAQNLFSDPKGYIQKFIGKSKKEPSQKRPRVPIHFGETNIPPAQRHTRAAEGAFRSMMNAIDSSNEKAAAVSAQQKQQALQQEMIANIEKIQDSWDALLEEAYTPQIDLADAQFPGFDGMHPSFEKTENKKTNLFYRGETNKTPQRLFQPQSLNINKRQKSDY